MTDRCRWCDGPNEPGRQATIEGISYLVMLHSNCERAYNQAFEEAAKVVEVFLATDKYAYPSNIPGLLRALIAAPPGGEKPNLASGSDTSPGEGHHRHALPFTKNEEGK